MEWNVYNSRNRIYSLTASAVNFSDKRKLRRLSFATNTGLDPCPEVERDSGYSWHKGGAFWTITSIALDQQIKFGSIAWEKLVQHSLERIYHYRAAHNFRDLSKAQVRDIIVSGIPEVRSIPLHAAVERQRKDEDGFQVTRETAPMSDI